MVKNKKIQIIHTNLQEYMGINDVAMYPSNGLIKYVFDIGDYHFEILYNYVDGFYRIVIEKRHNNQLQNVIFLTKSKKFQKDIKIILKKFNLSRKSFEDHMNAFTLYIVEILKKHEGLNCLYETYISDLNFDGIIDSKDYEIICKISTTQNAQTDLMTYLGDLDNDGAVDGFDAIILDLINKGMPPTLEKGDVNGDGRIDITDYDLLVSIVTTQGKATDNIMFNRCDINEDGAIDAFDVVYLDLYLNNLMPII